MKVIELKIALWKMKRKMTIKNGDLMVRVSDFSSFSCYRLCFTSRMIPEGAGLIADIHTWARGSYGTRCESIAPLSTSQLSPIGFL